MAVSRKDFELAAKLVRENAVGNNERATMCAAFSRFFEIQAKRFDSEKFREACQVNRNCRVRFIVTTSGDSSTGIVPDQAIVECMVGDKADFEYRRECLIDLAIDIFETTCDSVKPDNAEIFKRLSAFER